LRAARPLACARCHTVATVRILLHSRANGAGDDARPASGGCGMAQSNYDRDRYWRRPDEDAWARYRDWDRGPEWERGRTGYQGGMPGDWGRGGASGYGMGREAGMPDEYGPRGHVSAQPGGRTGGGFEMQLGPGGNRWSSTGGRWPE